MFFFLMFVLVGIFASMFIHADSAVKMVSDDGYYWVNQLQARLDSESRFANVELDERFVPVVGQTDHLEIREIKMVNNTPMIKVWDYSRDRMVVTFMPRHFIIPTFVDTPWGRQDITFRCMEPEYILGYEGIQFVLQWLKSKPCELSNEKVWRLKRELSTTINRFVPTPRSVQETVNGNMKVVSMLQGVAA